jgi:hypothetical protein
MYTLTEQRELYLFSEYISKSVLQFPQLREFMTSQWFLMNIFDRLGSQAKVKFVQDRAEHNFMNSTNFENMEYYFQVHLPKYDQLLREEKILTEGAHIDILTQGHSSGANKSKKTSAATHLSVTQSAATETGSHDHGGSGKEKRRDGGRSKPKPGRTSDSKGPRRGKNPGSKPKAAKSCRICCKACGYLCEGIFTASRGTAADREQMVRRCVDKKVCPGCFTDVTGESHKCQDQRSHTDKKGVRKTVDMARMRCKEAGCKLFHWGNNISLSNKICKCPRRSSTSTSVELDESPWVHTNSELISLCPQEQVLCLKPEGGVAKVMVTYDMASDSRLANSRAIRDLAHSWKKIRYHLKTAVGEQVHQQYQGQLHIIRQQASPLKLTFIGVEGNGVLHRQNMPPVKLPVECHTRGWDLSHRSVSCDYHILLDAGSVEHHPEKVLYRNKTGSTLILQSKLTGRPIPMGLFQPATSQDPEWTTYDHGPQDEEEVMGWKEPPPSHRRTQQTTEDTQVPNIFYPQDGPDQEPVFRSANQPTQQLPCSWRPSEKKKFNFPVNREPTDSQEKRMAQPPIQVPDLQNSTKKNGDYLNMETGSHGHGPTPGSLIRTLVTQRQRRHKAKKRKLQGTPRTTPTPRLLPGTTPVPRLLPRTTSVPRLLPRQYQIPVLHSDSNICTGDTTLDDQDMDELKELLESRDKLRQELTELEMEENSEKGGAA